MTVLAPGRLAVPESPAENPRLPHQIVLSVSSAFGTPGWITVSCNCLNPAKSPRSGRCRPRGIIDARKTFPTPDAMTAWRDWHISQGIEVSS
jgi:hypothetical protein